jgi:hypothetical protein
MTKAYPRSSQHATDWREEIMSRTTSTFVMIALAAGFLAAPAAAGEQVAATVGSGILPSPVDHHALLPPGSETAITEGW